MIIFCCIKYKFDDSSPNDCFYIYLFNPVGVFQLFIGRDTSNSRDLKLVTWRLCCYIAYNVHVRVYSLSMYEDFIIRVVMNFYPYFTRP